MNPARLTFFRRRACFLFLSFFFSAVCVRVYMPRQHGMGAAPVRSRRPCPIPPPPLGYAVSAWWFTTKIRRLLAQGILQWHVPLVVFLVSWREHASKWDEIGFSDDLQANVSCHLVFHGEICLCHRRLEVCLCVPAVSGLLTSLLCPSLSLV